jgi:regulator of sirC expression with transglutaminase-like and TPR domain
MAEQASRPSRDSRAASRNPAASRLDRGGRALHGLRRMRGGILLVGLLAAGILVGWVVGTHQGAAGRAVAAVVPCGSQGPAELSRLLSLDDQSLERLDPLEVDLAVARTIPGCESLDVARYKRVLDEWAERVRQETDRHLYRFKENPAEFKNSLAYFKALTLATVVGQDFKVGYHVESIAFDDPKDLFIHGVIGAQRGTCVSLPVLYMALGYRLGYPIRAVTTPKHMFCRWDDARTGERLNIEAANAGGLADYSDEHYMSWPTKVDPQDTRTGGALKSLTMREFLGVKLASRGDYHWRKGNRAEAQVSYALAHQLYPSCRSIFEIFASQVMDESDRYPWSPVHRGVVAFNERQVQSNRPKRGQKGLP